MRFLVLLLALLLGCTSAGAHTAPPASPVDIATPDAVSLMDKTVALTADAQAFCSGVWVTSSTIVTANHCVSDLQVGEYVHYVTQGDVYAPGELSERPLILERRSQLYSRDESHDLALLYAPVPPPHQIARIYDGIVRVGSHVQVVGMPLGNWFCYSSGDVAAVRYVKSHGYSILFVQTTAPISGGNSGGGLFSDSGELLGIAHATYTNGQNMNLFIHYQFVADLLRKGSF